MADYRDTPIDMPILDRGGAAHNVLAYGAKGDGLADDTAALRRAVAAAGASGKIELPRGHTFRLTETVLLKQGQTVFGGAAVVYEPVDGCTFANEGATTEGSYTAAGNITVRDIEIRAAAGNAIMFAHADGIQILGVRFTGWYHHCVDLNGCRNVIISDCVAKNAIAGNINGSAFQVDQAIGRDSGSILYDGEWIGVFADDTACSNVLIRDNIVENLQSFAFHLHRVGHSDISIVGNHARGCRYGVRSDDGITYTRITISDNQISGTVLYGIEIAGGASDLAITNNLLTDTGQYGIVVRRGPSPSRNVSITGNIIRKYSHSGIRLYNAHGFVVADNTVDLGEAIGATLRGIAVIDPGPGSIIGNSVDCAIALGTAGSRDTPGIWLARDDGGVTRDVEVTGNQVRRAVRGIWVRDGSEGVSVSGNAVSDISDVAILLGVRSGTATIHRGCTITGNAIRGVARAGVIIEHPSHCVVAGNSLRDFVGAGGATVRGILLHSTGDHNAVVGNTVDGVGKPANSAGLMIGCTHTMIASNTVSGFAVGLQQEAPALVGVVYVGNIVRGNTLDSSIDAGGTAAEQRFALNWIGNQSDPMIMPPFQIGDSNGGFLFSGAGDPEGNITAPKTAFYLRTTIPNYLNALYVKVSDPGGAGGWRAVPYLDAGGNLGAPGSAWDGGHVVMGNYHLWVDATGALRIKNGAPSSDTDGATVGSQA